MKKFYLFTLFVLTASFALAQNPDYYYWYKGEKITLHLNEDKLFLLFDQQVEPEELSQKLDIKSNSVGEIKKVKLGASLTPHAMRDTNEENYWTVVKESEIDSSSPFFSYRAPAPRNL